MDKILPQLFSDERWQQCLEHFFEDLYRRSSSDATVRSYRGVLVAFFSTHGAVPENVTRQEVEAFIYGKTDKAWAKSPDGKPATATTNKRRSALRSFYDYAAGYTVAGQHGPESLFKHQNPCAGIKHGKPARAYKALSLDEVKRFFAAIDRTTLHGLRDYSVFKFLLFSARRREEMARLKWGDLAETVIQDENGTTRLAWVYTFFGKGSSTVQDSAEIGKPAIDALMDYLENSGRLATIKADDPLFAAHALDGRGGTVHAGEVRALSSRQMSRLCKQYAALASIPSDRISLHSFRHTSAKLRYLSDPKRDIRAIQRLLRHKTINTTEIYLGALTSTSDEAAARLQEQLGTL